MAPTSTGALALTLLQAPVNRSPGAQAGRGAPLRARSYLFTPPRHSQPGQGLTQPPASRYPRQPAHGHSSTTQQHPPVNRSSLDTLTPVSVGPSTGVTQTHGVYLQARQPAPAPSLYPLSTGPPFPPYLQAPCDIPSTGPYLAPICTPVNRRPLPTSPPHQVPRPRQPAHTTSRPKPRVPSPVNRSSFATPTSPLAPRRLDAPPDGRPGTMVPGARLQ